MQPRAAPSSQCSPTNASPAVQPNVASQVQSRQCSLTNAAPTTQPHASQPSQLQVAKPAQPRVAKPSQTKVAKSAQAMNVNAPRSHSHDEHVMLLSMLQSLLS
jgi:predicted RNA-binding protein with PUA domain